MTNESEGLFAEDERSRILAQTEFNRPLILEAGAGTGKTAVLVARIVNWCLGSGWDEKNSEDNSPQEIAAKVVRSVVAITFTKAAAREMSTRVREVLWNLIQGTIPHGMQESLLASSYRERAAVLIPQLDLLLIGTIHSFCENILSRYPIQSGLHPKFTIDDERFILSRTVVREAISEELEIGLGNSSNADWLHLAKQGISLTQLESSLIPKLLDDPSAGMIFGSEDRELLDESSFKETYVKGCALLVKVGQNVVNPKSKEIISAADNSLSLIKTSNASLEDLAGFWSGKTSDLLNEWTSEVKSRDRKTLGKDVEALMEAARIVSPQVKLLLRYDPKTFSALHYVLGAVWRNAREKLERRGIVTFDEILRRTEVLLRTDCGTRNVLREGLSQILVDEFQDTNTVQCEILRLLTLTEGPKVGLFVVGDPKQSIFGFRNADLRAYEKFVEEIEQAGGRKLLLSVNFRSFPEILEEVTRSIGPLMLKERGRQPAFSELVSGRRGGGDQRGGGPRVSFWLGCGEDGTPLRVRDDGEGMQLEVRALVEDVLREKHAGVNWNQMALLVRTGNGIDKILSELRDANIPYSFDREPDKAPSREVLDIISLLRSIVNPGDMLSLAAWMTSSWVGLPRKVLWQFQSEGVFEEICALGTEGSRGVEYIRKNRLKEDFDLSPVERDNLVLCLHCLEDARSTLKRLSPEVWGARVRENFLFEAGDAIRRQGKHRLNKLTEFWDRFIAQLSHFPGSMQRILDELEVSLVYGSPEAPKRFQGEYGDAITVSTIHNAKGLDWENVYLLRMDYSGGQPPATELFRNGELEGVQLLNCPNPQYETIRRERNKDDEAEQIRLLYVAMTRAKNRLIVSGSLPGGSSVRERSFLGRIASKTFPTESFPQGIIEKIPSTEHFFDDPDTGRRFLFPSLMTQEDRKFSEEVENDDRGPELPALMRLDREIEKRKQHAKIRSNRLLHGIASEKAELDEAEVIVSTRVGPPKVDRKSALVVGEVVHGTLEKLVGKSLSETKQRTLIDSVKINLAQKYSLSNQGAVLDEVEEILQSFFGGALYRKFVEIYPGIVARELPVLAMPPEGDDEPLRSVAGSIDLLYRENNGTWVIADYKTDRVAPNEAKVLGQRYQRQGQIYVKAVQKSFELSVPPIFELWWLRNQEVTRL